MVIQFDSNKVKTISFLQNPDAKFVPPHELQKPDTRLKNFKWRIEEKPTRTDIIADSRPRPARVREKKAAAPSPEGEEIKKENPAKTEKQKPGKKKGKKPATKATAPKERK